MKNRIVVVALLLSACATTAEPEVTRLLLSYPGPTPSVSAAKASLVVRAVSVPDYLDRREVVYRKGLELHRYPDAQWAERPAKAVTRFISQALAAQRSDYNVQSFTTASGVSPDAALTIAIERFEPDESGVLQLHGSWRLTATAQVLASGRLDAEATLAAATAADSVAAMQQALMTAVKTLVADIPAPTAASR